MKFSPLLSHADALNYHTIRLAFKGGSQALLCLPGPYALLHDFYLPLCQLVEFVDELIDLTVGGFDVALKASFLLRVACG